MKKVLVLKTHWERDLWEHPREVSYRKVSYKKLEDWDVLRENLPLPALGVYIKRKKRDYTNRPFVYLKIKGMRSR